MIRVLIADDDANARATIARWLSFQPGFAVTAEASDGQDALDKARSLAVDVIVMDARMPRISGIDAVRALRAQGITTPVLVLSADESAERETEGMPGVSFLSKTRASPDSTANALRVLSANRGEDE